MLIVGFRGSVLDAGDPIAVALAAGLGGVILFDRDQTTGGARNIRSPAQLRTLTDSVRALAPGHVFIAIDQEGGVVSRLDPSRGFPKTRSQASMLSSPHKRQALLK